MTKKRTEQVLDLRFLGDGLPGAPEPARLIVLMGPMTFRIDVDEADLAYTGHGGVELTVRGEIVRP